MDTIICTECEGTGLHIINKDPLETKPCTECDGAGEWAADDHAGEWEPA